ncbi:queuine tRNA-ribosyltransferase family protein, partial [bacterium]|nr:queuine tRNA-ribosyltransferase family protein [bacterium]
KNIYNIINIKNSKYKNNYNPINSGSKIKELRNYSRNYLNYLFKIKDPLAYRLSSLNNLEFYIELMNKLQR